MKTYKGIIIDVIDRREYRGELLVENGKISEIKPLNHDVDQYILPGLIDAHVHIESSMTTPSVFAGMVLKKGTVGVVSDPHEIANVLGIEGINYMIEDAKNTALKIYFGVPSCVPATPFESSGSVLDANIVDELLARNDLYFLSEMMNFPGVINEFDDVISKIKSAKRYGKLVDGHAPGLRGEDLKIYIEAGISTDHECFSYEEAVEKIKHGMKILIREGSAARNFEELYPLISEYTNSVMLCTDDSHPDTILDEGHIDKMIKKGLQKGIDIYDLLQAAIVNPVNHYKLDIGLLQKGDCADFIIVDNLEDFNVQKTIINGDIVFEKGRVKDQKIYSKRINAFIRQDILQSDITIKAKQGKIKVIVAKDGELITGQELVIPKIENDFVISDLESDVLKMVVINRYKNTAVQIGFVKNIGLKKGAIASSIAHDSHNIIAVGVSDKDIVAVVNKLIQNKGGIVVGDESSVIDLKLEVAGLMTCENGEKVAQKYKQLNEKAKEYGTNLQSPFMTISFLSLLVIPELKLGDKGLFDVNKFDFVDLFEN